MSASPVAKVVPARSPETLEQAWDRLGGQDVQDDHHHDASLTKTNRHVLAVTLVYHEFMLGDQSAPSSTIANPTDSTIVVPPSTTARAKTDTSISIFFGNRELPCRQINEEAEAVLYGVVKPGLVIVLPVRPAALEEEPGKAPAWTGYLVDFLQYLDRLFASREVSVTTHATHSEEAIAVVVEAVMPGRYLFREIRMIESARQRAERYTAPFGWYQHTRFLPPPISNSEGRYERYDHAHPT
ncbi:hypothetical protein B0T26DRAFT_672850 [Lasiosphaeria miniovina]|uniref:Uncharacterized protein n=1 Tax=Lasiosphaeria miniovina TaxID=1954250 RepID=A0AA40E8V7_9PEZI|nr:uncharacterized protein B0T26DRAFT_672850 [Lasiosphaeria miniovina]KAK0728301.1 hypothetical protein B0T26DRAFT_672850 [Lasiosphaeria miniovina]